MRFLVLVCAMIALPALAQAPDSMGVYDAVAEMPELVGGMEALLSRVTYPEAAAVDNAEGRVFVQFVVTPEGAATDATCPRSPDERLCAAAIAAVAASAFEPGRHEDQPVAVRMVVPVLFRLPEPTPARITSLPPGTSLNDASWSPRPRNADGEEIIETPPELIGGIAGLQMRVEYPERARRAGIEGTVFVQFVVDEQGRTSEIECVRSPHRYLCDAAKDAVRASEFIPGTQRGRPVKVRFTVPVRFRLN